MSARDVFFVQSPSRRTQLLKRDFLPTSAVRAISLPPSSEHDQRNATALLASQDRQFTVFAWCTPTGWTHCSYSPHFFANPVRDFANRFVI